MRKNKGLIVFIAVCLFLLLLILPVYNYIDNINIYQDFSIRIEGVTPDNASAINVSGITPMNKKRQIVFYKYNCQWISVDNYFLKSIEITIPDSLIDKVAGVWVHINNGDFWIAAEDLKEKESLQDHHSYYLPATIKNSFSLRKVISLIIRWPSVQKAGFVLFIGSAIVLLLMSLSWLKKQIKQFLSFFRFKSNEDKWNRYIKANFLMTRKYWIFILSVYLITELLFHVLFYFETGWYLTTSGVLLIILLSIFLYYILLGIKGVFHLNYCVTNSLPMIITIAIFLIFIEIVLVLYNYKTASKFEYQKLYYQSQYIPQEKNWFHLYHYNHYLQTSEFSYFRKDNSDTLSDIEHKVPKNENEYRIMGMGDSFTEGSGADVDSTWLRFLERSLKKQPLKKQLTFFNAGVGGSDPFFEYILLKERLLKYKPDLVLLALNCSDLVDISLRGGMERFLPDGKVQYNPEPWWEPIYALSHISRLYFEIIGYKEGYFRYKKGDFAKEKKETINAIGLFNKLSQEYGFKLLVIFHPSKEELLIDASTMDDVYMNVSKTGRPACFNLRTFFIKEIKMNSFNYLDYYWKYDGHHNAKGYEAFARGVEWKLKDMGIIDSLIAK